MLPHPQLAVSITLFRLRLVPSYSFPLRFIQSLETLETHSGRTL
jgi:hypothetical protein